MSDWLPERLPEDIEAERALLATCCAAGAELAAAEAVFALGEDDFVHPAHRAVFKSLKTLVEAQVEINSITLKDALDQAGDLSRVGGFTGLVELLSAEEVGRPQVLVDLLSRKRKLRQLIRLGARLVRQAADEEEPPDTLVEQAGTDLFRLAQGHLRKGLEHIGDVARDTMEGLLDRLEGRGSTGLKVSFSRLDNITQGFQPGNLIILAARPGIGKTALALNWVLHAADKSKAHVAFFSLEMSNEEVFTRLLAAKSGVDMKAVAAGAFDVIVQKKLLEARDALLNMHIYVNDQAGITVREITAMVDRHLSHSNQKLDMVVVDYLQLLSSPEGSRAAKQSEAVRIGEISRGFKLLAKDHGIPVLVLSQLNREVEHRQSGRPQLSDLRDCVAGDTLVVLADGSRRPIRELVGETPEVLAMDPSGRIVSAQSDRIWMVGQRPTRTIRTASGRRLEATDRHRTWTQRGWQRLCELVPGDRVALARQLPEPAGALHWPDLTMALLGQMIGDGSYLKHQPMRYTTASEENSALVREAAETCFGMKVTRYSGCGNWHGLLLSGNGDRWHPSGMGKWFRDLGIFDQRSHEKRIPEAVFRLSNAQIAILLRHLWATDGCISVGKNLRRGMHFSTCSLGLANDVAALLLRLGIVARTRVVPQGPGYRHLFVVWVNGADGQKAFLDRVGAFGPRLEPAMRLRTALQGVIANTNVDTLPVNVVPLIRASMKAKGVTTRAMSAMRSVAYNGTAAYRFAPSRKLLGLYARLLEDSQLAAFAQSDIFWDTIVAIEDGPIQDVYDLTVPGPASWLADGLVSHNSGAIEQDADIVMFIHRKMKPVVEGEPEDRTAELLIAKHRNGPIGVVPLFFEAECTRYREMERSTDSEYGADYA
ncbi:MAG: DnaB-like helicase C-terminal domain-containing protein [Holophaga sp.]|jgi:replicative DNA helicase